ncbi:MAG: hypothetical protein EOO04_25020 [Chitinophagaceae bacterium]|nr:MAG: hypothetical protein EOO04_25020 [Chitinophagaceae bacterium]
MKFILVALLSMYVADFSAPDSSRDQFDLPLQSVTGTDTPLVMLTYGLPVGGATAMARRDIARAFGFSYHAVAGCVVTESLLDSVRIVNRQTIASIAALHGKDWEQRFEKEVDVLTTRYTRALKLASGDPLIISRTTQLEKKQEYLALDVVGISPEGFVLLEAYSFRWSGDKGQKVVYSHLIVDLKRSVVSLTDQVERVYEL